MHRPVPVRAGEGHLVDVWAVRIELGQVLTGEFGQLSQGADADQMAGFGFASPHRQRRPQYRVRESAQSTLFRSHSP